MDLALLRGRFPPSHHALITSLEAVLSGCRVFAEPVTRIRIPPSGEIDYDQYLNFALSVYADKFLQLYRSVAESLLSEQYLIYSQAARSIIENAATLRYYARDSEVSLIRTEKAATPDAVKAAMLKIDALVRGSRFTWDAFLSGRFDDIRGEAGHKELQNKNIKTCLSKWFAESPNAESLYDILSEMVHPSVGSNVLIMRTENGFLLAGGEGGKSVAFHSVLPTLAGTIGAFKIIQRSFQELHASRLKSTTHNSI